MAEVAKVGTGIEGRVLLREHASDSCEARGSLLSSNTYASEEHDTEHSKDEEKEEKEKHEVA